MDNLIIILIITNILLLVVSAVSLTLFVILAIQIRDNKRAVQTLDEALAGHLARFPGYVEET